MDTRTKFENYMVLRNFAANSITSYLSVFDIVVSEDEEIFSRSQDEIITYLAKKIKKQNLSASYVAQFVSVFNIVIKQILKRTDSIKIPRPNKPIIQPDILTTEEIIKMLSCITNIKHKAIICLMYATGIRVSEVCNMRINDIDKSTNCIKIRQAKGKKDRVAMLDPNLLNVLRDYFVSYKPNVYLFNGAKGEKYSSRSIQKMVTDCAAKAGIRKHISSHSMRHSCFTQLVKDGTDIRYIQKLAGHKNINTTARYLQIADMDIIEMKSPFSNLNLK